MSGNSIIISSGESEKRWVLAMEKNFRQHHIDFSIPFCVFSVPKTLSEAKPEAYAPHHLGLGPLHHLRPDLYAMHNHKLAAITKFLLPEKIPNFHLLVDALVPLEPLIRACYDRYLDLDIATLAWIFAIDALYLLHFLNNYPQMKHLAADVLMLENQIPLVLLNKILQILQLTPPHDFQPFLDDQSPLELTTNGAAAALGNANDLHLLHRMYHSIVNNRGIQDIPVSMLRIGVTRILVEDVAQSMQFLADRGLPGAGTAAQIFSFVSKIPWGKISAMFKKNEQASSADEIGIPSVSQMAEIAKIKFIRTHGGIRDIRFHDEEKKFHLPSIRLTATSEIVLRNLVAYEAASAEAGAILELAEYVDLMCGIIDSSKDVDILREEGIVQSELDDEEVAGIFNGISKSEKKKKRDDRTSVEEAIENVNTRYSSLLRVKAKKFVEKYVYAAFKFMSVIITIAVVVLLVLQAFCSVFGCSSWFGKIATQSEGFLLSYQ